MHVADSTKTKEKKKKEGREISWTIMSEGVEVMPHSIVVLDHQEQLLDDSTFTTQTPGRHFATCKIMAASPVKKKATNESMQDCLQLEETGRRFAKLDPRESWLPITESRTGSACTAAFHTLSSGLGAQALLLPLAFSRLGWTWGIISLTLAFSWQFYTLWLLIQLHESVDGMRYSRYLQLSMAAFGNKLGKLLALFPTMYLSGGTCVTLIMIGGGTMRMFFQIVGGLDATETTGSVNQPTMTEWYLLFTISAVILAQLPNLNSVAGVSLVGSAAAVSCCTIVWVFAVIKDRPGGDVSSNKPLAEKSSEIGRICSILNALGIIALAFRGHNLVLEIQGTLPSSPKQSSAVAMWKGVKISYLVIALCLFPLATGGYWAHGNLIPSNGSIMSALNRYVINDTSKAILGMTSFLVALQSLASFQIYAMPVFDNLEFRYISSNNRPCPWWLRAGIRVFFGCFAFFVAVALPFLPSLAGLLGGISLPITFAYPCIMWIIVVYKPEKHSAVTWYINWSLGILGVILSILLVFGATWTIETKGIDANFFRPQ